MPLKTHVSKGKRARILPAGTDLSPVSGDWPEYAAVVNFIGANHELLENYSHYNASLKARQQLTVRIPE